LAEAQALMTDTSSPKRRFWQVHLSTAVLMMVVTGVVSWLNTIQCYAPPLGTAVNCSFFCGWPLDAADLTGRGWPVKFTPWEMADGSVVYFEWSMLTINGLICLALLIVAAIAIEWFTRRMKRGAP
jgi:hypothetical protein